MNKIKLLRSKFVLLFNDIHDNSYCDKNIKCSYCTMLEEFDKND